MEPTQSDAISAESRLNLYTQKIEQIKTEMATIEASVVEAQGLFDKGSFMEALNKVKAANDRAVGINTELKDAIAKVKGKK